MPSWVTEDTPIGRVHRRPMGATERAFFWYSEHAGTGDSLQHCQIDVLSAYDFFSEESVSRAWITMKQRFPLLGAQFQFQNDDPTQDTYISISEARLAKVQPGELIFGEIASQDVEALIDEILNTPRTFTHDKQASVHVLRSTDIPRRYYLILQIAHTICDGIAGASYLRNFSDTISASSRLHLTKLVPLEERLPSLLSCEELRDELDYNHPRTRWRRAIGRVLVSIIMSKMIGGQTLPCTITESTPWTPARSSFASAVFSPKESAQLYTTCHNNGITLGHALTVLGQVALSRVLHRRYFCGEISEEEWEHRKRQPMHQGGPVNLRPYMNKEWYENGGGGEMMLAVGSCFSTLPFMPLNESREDLDQGSPKLEALLSKKRFFHRCRIIKSHIKKVLKSPLAVHITAMSTERHGRARNLALKWQNSVAARNNGSLVAAKAARRTLIPNFTVAFGGSNFGDADVMVPQYYPLPSSHPLSPLYPSTHPFNAGHVLPAPHDLPEEYTDPKPVLHLGPNVSRLRCRPAELYLGSKTVQRSFQIWCYFDENVYARDTVNEWVKEIRDAARWYLGDNNTYLDREDLVALMPSKL